MKIIPIVAAGVVFITSHVFAQTAEKVSKRVEDFYNGIIVLKSGEVLEREFSYNPLVSEGLIQFSYDSILYTMGPGKISSFSFYDPDNEVTRKFQSFPVLNKMNGVTREYFMEILHDSPFISMVGQKTVLYTPVYAFSYSTATSKPRINKDYQRFLVEMSTAELHDMTKKELYILTKDKKDKIKSFVKKNRIRLKHSSEYIQVIDFYTSLK